MRRLTAVLLALVTTGADGRSEPDQPSQPAHASSSGWVSVASYGAKGDGKADDTVAIQAALRAAAGQHLHFPPGTFRLTARLTVSSDTHLVADGAVTVVQTTPGEIVFAGRDVSNVTIRGFTLKGAGSEVPPVGGGTTAGAITFEGPGSSIAVEQNTIAGFFNGIAGIHLAGFTVRDNEVSRWRIYAVLASQSSDFHIENNRLHDNDMPAGTEWSGSRTYRMGETAHHDKLMWMSVKNGNAKYAPATGSDWIQIATYGISATGGRPKNVLQSRNTIAFNRIRNNPMWDGIMTHDCDGLVIGFNDIRNVRNGIELGANTAGYWSDKTVVVGNYLEGTTTDVWSAAGANNSGIALFGLDPATAARNASIADNVIVDFGRLDTGKRLGGGISLAHAAGISVSGNRVVGVGPSRGGVGAITLNGSISEVAISGNTLSTGEGARAGILIYNATVTGGVTVNGNIVATGASVPGIHVSSVTADAIVITGNALSDARNASDGIRMEGDTIRDLVVIGNTASGPSGYRAIGSRIQRERVDFTRP